MLWRGNGQGTRRHDSAATTAGNRRHWANADGLSADSAASADVRRTLRNRARYEVANNSYARGIVLTLANDTIWDGAAHRRRALLRSGCDLCMTCRSGRRGCSSPCGRRRPDAESPDSSGPAPPRYPGPVADDAVEAFASWFSFDESSFPKRLKECIPRCPRFVVCHAEVYQLRARVVPNPLRQKQHRFLCISSSATASSGRATPCFLYNANNFTKTKLHG